MKFDFQRPIVKMKMLLHTRFSDVRISGTFFMKMMFAQSIYQMFLNKIYHKGQ